MAYIFLGENFVNEISFTYRTRGMIDLLYTGKSMLWTMRVWFIYKATRFRFPDALLTHPLYEW